MVIVLALAAVSVVNLHSTEQGTESTAHLTQLGWFGAGTIMMFFVSTMDARFIRRLVPLFYVSVVIAPALVLVIGKEVNGSKRWLNLGFASFRLNLQNAGFSDCPHGLTGVTGPTATT